MKFPLKKIFLFTGLATLIIGITVANRLVQTRQLFNLSACDCSLYNFSVSISGQVSVVNGQSIYEPGQQAKVYIQDNLVATLTVPALPANQSAQLGTVEVPTEGSFTWKVVGTSFCSDTGSHFVPTPTPTLIPEITPSVSPSPSPTSEPEPTATLSPSPIPTSEPEPTDTPQPTPSPTPTSAPTHTPSPDPTSTPGPADPAPGAPNICNGTCGSDSNCGYAEDGTKLVCANGLCRHPSCTDQESCHCPADTRACIGDRVIIDTNRNGVQDPGETGLAGTTIGIYSGSSLISSAVTDNQGNYRICGLPPGEYTVKYTLPSGYVLSSAHSVTQVRVLAGSNTLDIDGYAWLGTSTSLPTAGSVWPTTLITLSGFFLLLFAFALL